MFTLRKKTQQQEIHFSHFILQLAMHAARGCLPLIQLMSAHRVEICRVLYRAYFTNTLYILPSAYIAICTPWLSHPHILHIPDICNFFTQAKFLENKIYTKKTRKLRQNTQ